MSSYRRYFVPGGTYFFTLITEQREPLFDESIARSLLGQAMRLCLARHPVEVIAMVLLPEHLHAIWALPPGDQRYSMRWGWIKRKFSMDWIDAGGRETTTSVVRRRERRRNFWQRRFWEHTIRDIADLEAHFDYIHYNPVKHGLVKAPRDWPWSTFHRWVRAGHYAIDWARQVDAEKLPGGGSELPNE